MRLQAALVAFATLLSSACATAPYVKDGLEIRTFTRASSNALLVTKNGNSFLVDAGYEKEAEGLAADLTAAGFDPARLKAIVLTHGHADHSGGARYFQSKYGTKVIAGAGDAAMLKAGANEPLCPTGFLARRRLSTDQAATFTGYAADVLVESAPLLLEPLVGFAATVTPVPGHTKGSLVVTAGDALLVGDLLRGSLVGSGAETHLYICDLEDNKRSVARVLREVAPSAAIVFTGHFGPMTRAAVAEQFEVR
jgi:glyoxylase-like metal-dependent hydrolase (beta-lactamase superfamily II)